MMYGKTRIEKSAALIVEFNEWHARNCDTLPGSELHRVERQGMLKAWIAASNRSNARRELWKAEALLRRDELGWEHRRMYPPDDTV